MNRDEIIRMAREAGFVVDEVSQQHQPNCIFHTHYLVDELLERFAALVAAAEREECAALADAQRSNVNVLLSYPEQSSAAYNIGVAIRARGQA